MPLRYLMDQHVPKATTIQLRLCGVDVLTAYEDGSHELEDSELLDRSTELDRVLFSQDDDLLVEAHHRQEHGIPFHGVVYGHQLKVTVGQCVQDLELLAKTCIPEDMKNRVEYLPL